VEIDIIDGQGLSAEDAVTEPTSSADHHGSLGSPLDEGECEFKSSFTEFEIGSEILSPALVLLSQHAATVKIK
jgi:hypothetical protein